MSLPFSLAAAITVEPIEQINQLIKFSSSWRLSPQTVWNGQNRQFQFVFSVATKWREGPKYLVSTRDCVNSFIRFLFLTRRAYFVNYLKRQKFNMFKYFIQN